MNIIAFDLGSRCGFAALRDGVLKSGAHEAKYPYSHSPGAWMQDFEHWLLDVHRWCSPTHVVWEQPIIRHAKSEAWSLMIGGMVTRVQQWAYVRSIVQMPYVRPSTLKKFATGSGKAEKGEMIEAMRVRWKLPALVDDDESDALAVLAWAVNTFRNGEAG